MIRIDSDRDRIRLVLTGVAVMLAVWSVGCASTGPPSPETGYRAQATVEISDPSKPDPVSVRFVEFYRSGKRRRDLDQIEASVWIDRPDLRVTWVLNPREKSFEEHPFWDVEGLTEPVPDPFGPRARAHFEPLGSESLEGLDADKFAVKGETISGMAWLTRDRIPLRFRGTLDREGSSVELRIDYLEIEREEQANHLFEIPMNYAGYENRKQKGARHANQSDDAVRSLKEQQWGSPPPPPPPFVPPPPPMR